MHKCLTLFFFLFLIHFTYAQVMPGEDSKLNFRIIGFKIPPAPFPHAKKFQIEIAAGRYFSEDSFKKNIIITSPLHDNKIVADIPFFGREYTWRYSFSTKGKMIYSRFRHFAITSIAQVDTTLFRFRILKPAEAYKDNYVFLDGNVALYDMKGNPVWYLIYTGGLEGVGDLKVSSHNTITFFENNRNFEETFNGKVLWKAPNDGKVSGDTMEFYHHEFTHLDNGHYMTLGSEFKWQFPSTTDSLADTSKQTKPIEFGTIIEYDEKGNIVWSWKSSKYFLQQDPHFIKPFPRYHPYFDSAFRAKFDYLHPSILTLEKDVHENAFFFDQENSVIYLSFKNVSRILKIKYPEGTVLNAYGPVQTQGGSETGVNLFCHQHCCRLSQDGYLYCFNNNMCDTSPAKISMFKESAKPSGSLKKVWEYQCTVEGNYERHFNHGGSAFELPDRSMFICMGSEYNKTLIVNRKKKVLWSGIPEKWDLVNKKWTNLRQYRASIISRQQLEDLVWAAEETLVAK